MVKPSGLGVLGLMLGLCFVSCAGSRAAVPPDAPNTETELAGVPEESVPDIPTPAAVYIAGSYKDGGLWKA